MTNVLYGPEGCQLP